mgnify:CR=1 FL=1
MAAIRITPAYAGKSVSPIENWRYRRDHPRLCGEKASLPPFCPCPWGSPPPMRGKGKSKIQDRFVFRITPAYAGKSVGIVQPLSVKLGSPPPMRGKADITIPADAPVQDHPRLCGEKPGKVPPLPYLVGSPPPMRGKGILHGICGIGIRITPAYAGKSFHFFGSRCGCRDHPRLCGEKQHFFYFLVYTGGSPPPMRGKASCDRAGAFHKRITPAYAGKSSKRQ